MTIEQFDKVFKPINNPFVNDEAIYYFDSVGEELDFVSKQEENKIWTVVEGDSDDNLYLVNGYHNTNRMGYMITEEKWKEGDNYEILYCEDIKDSEED